MTLIADSGSTKTRWAFIAPDGVRTTTSEGLNPRLTDAARIGEVLRAIESTLIAPDEECRNVYFYGAGCGTPQMQQTMAEQLAKCFPDATIEVAGDLLGACRATCGNEPGLVGILGTGSNLCYYDGSRIARQIVSTGYILGDEGSGNHIGRMLLKDYLMGYLPWHLSTLFHERYPYSTDEFLDHLYHQPCPNRFLASLAPFAAEHRQDEYIAEILDDCFSTFLGQLRHFVDLGPLPLHLVGGLVDDFAAPIRAAADKNSRCCKYFHLATLIKDPIDNLVRYHSER